MSGSVGGWGQQRPWSTRPSDPDRRENDAHSLLDGEAYETFNATLIREGYATG